MLKRILLSLCACAMCCIAFSQNYRECVYLKNGSIIKGIVLEQVPGGTIKIQTSDGSLFVYDFDQVERITKEFVDAPKVKENNTVADSGKVYLSYAKNGLVNVTDGGENFTVLCNDAKLQNYMTPTQYNDYVSAVKQHSTGLLLFSIGLATDIVGSSLLIIGSVLELDGMAITGSVFSIIGSPIWIAGIPIWAVGASRERRAIENANLSRGNYTLEIAPSIQPMNLSTTTGRKEMAVGATLAFRF